jgi:NAD(P)-dependent dehydrogenase (short-subunit alcohol dehydrogenase family)
MQAKAQEIRLMGPTVVALTRSAAVFDLSGHVAVVTGGNSGIGLGMADGLARAGADVCIWGRTAERNEQAREQLAAHGTKVHAISVDVAEAEAVDAAFEETVATLGGVDSCFANAGVGSGGVPFLEMSLDEFRRVTRVNLEGAFLTLQGAARRMIDRGGGSLVGVASLAAIEGAPRGQHYAASKGGLISMIRACAVELARHGIRANAILPGWIDTPMTAGTLPGEPFTAKVLPRVPARRWGQPDDFAGAAVYLASPASAYHSGDALIIDGGYRVF